MSRAAVLTPFGKYIRKLRIDHGRILADDANYLQVTSAYLSSVEVGKKAVPRAWEPVLAARYGISDAERRNFRRAIVISDPIARIQLPPGTNDLVRRAVHLFNEHYRQFTKEQWQAMGELLGVNDPTYEWSLEQ